MKALFLLLMVASAFGEVVSPDEAAKRVGKMVTVEMVVKSTGQNSNGNYVELYSTTQWQDPSCFFVRLTETVAAKLRRLGIQDMERHFRDRVVRVTGVVNWLSFEDKTKRWPCSVVSDLEALEVRPPRYEYREITGFKVYLHPELQRHPDGLKTALEELTAQLNAITQKVPAARVAQLRTVPIRLEWARTEHAANYGWDEPPGWDDADPAAGAAVTLNNATLFVSWSRHGQPWMVMHELAHAYQHRFLDGDHHAGIRKAYANAMGKKLYASVAYVGGGKKEAYATKDAREYFAELTEAYFGKNDYYPFTREDLKVHDPVGFELMREVWETPAVH